MKLENMRPIQFTIISSIWIIVAVKVWERLRWIFTLTIAPSTDAYFYLQEIKFRAETASGYYVHWSPFFWAAGQLRSLLALSDLMTFHLLVVVSLALMSLAVAFRASGYLRPTLVLAVWSSELIFYRHYAFLQQAMSMAFWGLACVLFSSRIRVALKNAAILTCLAISTCTHIFGAILTVLLLPVIISVAPARRHLLWGGVFILGLGALWYLWNSPRILFDAGQSLYPGWVQTCNQIACSMSEWLEFSILTVVWILLLAYVLTQQGKRLPALLLAGCFFLNLPLWSADGHMQMRLAFSSIWVLFFAIICVSHKLSHSQSWNQAMSIMVLFLAVVSSIFERKNYSAPSFPIESIKESAHILRKILPQNAFILAPHGFQFAFTYFLNRSSAKEMPIEKQRFEIFHVIRISRFKRRCPMIKEYQATMEPPSCLRISDQYALRK